MGSSTKNNGHGIQHPPSPAEEPKLKTLRGRRRTRVWRRGRKPSPDNAPSPQPAAAVGSSPDVAPSPQPAAAVGSSPAPAGHSSPVRRESAWLVLVGMTVALVLIAIL